MKILVTGGTGFIGKNTALHLKKLGHTVTIQGRDPVECQKMQDLGFAVLKEDARDALQANSATRKICAEQDVIINCAGLSRSYGIAQEYYVANVLFVKVLTEVCLASKHNPLFIHLSSPSIYANLSERLNVSENEPLPKKSLTPYPASKRLADEVISKAEQQGLRAIKLRPQIVYGPGDEKILGRLIKSHEKGPLPVFNQGKTLIDVTYIDNLVHFIELCLTSKPAVGQTFNLSDGNPQPIMHILRELFEKQLQIPLKTRTLPFGFNLMRKLLWPLENIVYPLLQKLGLDPNPFFTTYSLSIFAVSQTHAISAARQIGYSPKISTEEGIKHYVDWHHGKHKSMLNHSSTKFIQNQTNILPAQEKMQMSFTQGKSQSLPSWTGYPIKSNQFFIQSESNPFTHASSNSVFLDRKLR